MKDMWCHASGRRAEDAIVRYFGQGLELLQKSDEGTNQVESACPGGRIGFGAAAPSPLRHQLDRQRLLAAVGVTGKVA